MIIYLGGIFEMDARLKDSQIMIQIFVQIVHFVVKNFISF